MDGCVARFSNDVCRNRRLHPVLWLLAGSCVINTSTIEAQAHLSGRRPLKCRSKSLQLTEIDVEEPTVSSHHQIVEVPVPDTQHICHDTARDSGLTVTCQPRTQVSTLTAAYKMIGYLYCQAHVQITALGTSATKVCGFVRMSIHAGCSVCWPSTSPISCTRSHKVVQDARFDLELGAGVCVRQIVAITRATRGA